MGECPDLWDERPFWVPDELTEQVLLLEDALTSLHDAHGAQAMSHLADLISTEVRYESLVRTVFRDTIWTRIEWSRTLGHPSTAKLADGFVVKNQWHEIDAEVGPNGVINTSRTVDAPTAPSLWDGPHDEETFRVSVMMRGQRPWMNRVGVALRPGVTWEGHDGPWWLRPTRRIVYPEMLRRSHILGLLALDADGITLVDDFRVVPWDVA